MADIADFPYAVSLKKKGEHHCGGSLVSPLVRFHSKSQTTVPALHLSINEPLNNYQSD